MKAFKFDWFNHGLAPLCAIFIIWCFYLQYEMDINCHKQGGVIVSRFVAGMARPYCCYIPNSK